MTVQGRGAGSPQGARRAPGGEPGRSDRARFSSRRKMEAVLRLLRGETLDALSRQLGVTAAAVSSWRDEFLAGGQASLKSRRGDERDDGIKRLRAKVGGITMDNELLLERCRAAGQARGLRRRRSKG